MTATFPSFHPDQKAGRQHDGHGMPLEPRLQAALVPVQAWFPLGLFMKPLPRVTTMGHAAGGLLRIDPLALRLDQLDQLLIGEIEGNMALDAILADV